MKTRADGRRSNRLRGFDYSLPGAYFVTICAQDRACVFGSVVNGVICLSAAGRMVRTVWDEIPRFYPGVEVDAIVVMPNHVHGIVILTGAASNGRDVEAVPLDRDVGAAPRGRPPSSIPRDRASTPVRAIGPGQARGPAPTDPSRGPAPTDPSRGPAPGNSSTDPTRGPAPGNSSTDPTRGPAPGNSSTDPTRGPAPGNSSTDPTRGPAPTNPSTDTTRGSDPTDPLGAEDVVEVRGTIAETRRPMTLGDVMHRFKTMTTTLYADGVHQAQWPPFRRRLWQRDYYEHVIRDAGALQRIRTYIERNPLRWRTDAQNPHRDEFVDSG